MSRCLIDRVKKSVSADMPSPDDVPILLSPISDMEPSPAGSMTNIKKHAKKSTKVTRTKRKKFRSDPPIYW